MEVAAVPLPRDPLRSGGLAPEMVTVAAGRFQYFTARPVPDRVILRQQHLEWVTFDRPFAIGKYEVTRGDFERFVDQARYRTEARRDPGYGCSAPSNNRDQRNTGRRWNRPGFDQTARHPVVCVSIRDAIAYARWLSQETGHKYRLPSASEWQYAARAGSPAAMLYIGRDTRETSDVCRYAHRADCFDDVGVWGGGYTVEVGSLLPNDIDLHDMDGNVEEVLMACLHRYPRREPDEDSLSPTTDDYFQWFGGGVLTPRGSPEDPQTCDFYVGTAGGSWYLDYLSDSLRVNAERRRRREQGFGGPVGHTPIWREVDSYHRNSQNWTGFRLVRELPGPDDVQ